jgi:DTW domain-containing protein YfiP
LRLVLLDGTWRKTRKLLHANPLLQALPRWPLPAPPPSRYTIRRAQRPDQVSTLEAACLALGHLEGEPARYVPLLSAFDGWVAEQARWAAAGRPTERLGAMLKA